MALTAAQRAMRATGIGASEIGAIAGLDPHRTPLQVWMEKKGLSDFDGNPHTRWGTRLEDTIVEAYIEESKTDALPVEVSTIRSRTAAWMLATPDRLFLPGRRRIPGRLDRLPVGTWGLEVKKRNSWMRHQWGPSGTDEVPDGVASQAYWGMEVLGVDRWDVAVLIDSSDFRMYTLPRNDAIIGALKEIGQRFYDRHIASDVPPDHHGDRAASEYVRRIFRIHGEALKEPTPAAAQWARQLFQLREEIKAREVAKEALEVELQLFIGTDAGIQGDGWKITWKQAKGGTRVDWEAVAKDVGSLHADELATAIARFTTESKPARQFRCTPPRPAEVA